MFESASLDAVPDLADRGSWVIADSFPPLTLWSKGASEKDTKETDFRRHLGPGYQPRKNWSRRMPLCDPNDAFFVPFHSHSQYDEAGSKDPHMENQGHLQMTEQNRQRPQPVDSFIRSRTRPRAIVRKE